MGKGTTGRKRLAPASTDDAKTARAEERTRENEEFVPVIIKRNDESRRHPDDVLQIAINAGLEQLDRPGPSLALSSVAAGLILGFTAMAVAIVTVALEPLDYPMLQRLAAAVVYPIGFVLCIMSGTELFTEHTATAVYPVLDRRAPARKLVQLWGIVAAGNIVGAAASAGLLTVTDSVVGARDGYVSIGRHLMATDASTLFVSALLAGWLMALGAWLIHATPPAVSQIWSIFLVTFLIGAAGLHHSIAGSAEAFTALFISEEFASGQVAAFIGVALVGNLVGGSLFVAALNYGHIRKSQETDPE